MSEKKENLLSEEEKVKILRDAAYIHQIIKEISFEEQKKNTGKTF